MTEEISAAEMDRLAAMNEAERNRDLMTQHGTARSVLWPKRRPVYLVRVWLWDAGDRFECSGLDITRLSRGKPISSTIMRQLPVGALVDEAIRDLLTARIQVQEAQIDAVSMKAGTDAGWAVAAADDRRRLEGMKGQGKGRRYPEGHLEEVVRVVRKAERDGRPKQAAVAQAFGRSRSAAGNHIAIARSKGMFDQPPEEEQ